MKKILVTGARGQVGSDLVIALRQRSGVNQVIETGRRKISDIGEQPIPYQVLDVTDNKRLEEVIEHYQVGTIYHLAGILSAQGESHPDDCWKVNLEGLRNVLEAAKSYQIKVFWPSSIAVFGANTPKIKTPQTTIKEPSTIYGITKATGELLCQYYAHRFGVDVRSLRLPGIISYNAPPGGGTTDFAVEIFTEAIKNNSYVCFLRPETRLPMMYMPDTIKAILKLMEADPALISVRSSYNLAAISFSVAELVAEIQKHLPNFTCYYQPDFRQAIADSWPTVIDDTKARNDWGWQPSYDLPAIVADMFAHLLDPQFKSFDDKYPKVLAQSAPTKMMYSTTHFC
ncbi:nucleoside-diphosphate-sugar epimerase [Xenococcus sp. PCC 7305]|uniref:NAD-dependent epimerase/dehydratase family protein n=1 Tax=Xenococcus sp. PCC 7305 TaxID=102125 RepID=UPI0002AC9EAC|nr:NAD-dependent epimerase/dehydratase family protein [Xenococcus sp. PCC 7305]ELS03287.1 nucleoside-diphosphate-sugar epimerase [Xenococcus sp. PCC 7305]